MFLSGKFYKNSVCDISPNTSVARIQEAKLGMLLQEDHLIAPEKVEIRTHASVADDKVVRDHAE